MSGSAACWGRILTTTFFSGALFAVLIPGFIVSLPPLLLPKDPNNPKWYEATPVLPDDPNNPKSYEVIKGTLGRYFSTRRITLVSVLVHFAIFTIIMFIFEILIAGIWERCL